MEVLQAFRPLPRGVFKVPKAVIQHQPNPRQMDVAQHMAMGGMVIERDDDDLPVEFGGEMQTLRNQEMERDLYRSYFARFDNFIYSRPAKRYLDDLNTNGSSSADNCSGDVSGESNSNIIIGDDNPLALPGPNRITVGVEFELSLAVSRSWSGLQDPHPNDGRWQSENLIPEDETDPFYRLSLRNLVIDTLRRHGLVASKTKEMEIGLDGGERGWLQDLNDGRSCPNLPTLMLWQPYYRWDQRKSRSENCILAARDMSTQFITFHDNNGLELHRTRDQTIEDFSIQKLPLSVHGLDRSIRHDEQVNIRGEIAQNWLDIIRHYQDGLEAAEEGSVDSKCIQVPGADPKYFSWTCTVDESMAVSEVLPRHYEIPGDSILPPANPSITLMPRPPQLYKWWPGEVKSPIYDYDDPATLETLRKACAALRNTYRIHKPMAVTETGLHIHFGQENGWTLLQLKKFTTFWLLAEQFLETLHREERSKGNIYALPLRDSCSISAALFRHEEDPRVRENLPTTRNRDPQRSYEYTQLMNMHVPVDLPAEADFPQALREIITEVWQYDTITGLSHGMTCSEEGDYGSVMYRVRGNKRTGSEPGVMQTLEVRSMQGTLDADHVWRWMSICQGMIRFCRDSTPEEFNDGLRKWALATETLAKVIGVPEEYFAWFEERKNERGYFAYPDADRVNWADPFMVPGFADVYEGLSTL
ncbi:uncharacterized protein GGS22DRAFT_184892 [Annulohypoxylon maeteangense]|uniref:uncharacterized protein n=1 Tax=Annulohypoxylon maeteangense TaxID=1927788 RepID=UPI002008A517|nr:uncharacterized protein GGS22DRAFT_184892 [Annulohypoxylon maeteangense]KAI0889314.1 hypothetical protein GGS22DRAFT_184892 [Annulohypoxylon maeteangense]